MPTIELPLEIQQYISKHPNLIIGKEDCKYCSKARDLLDDHFVNYKYTEDDCLQIRQFLNHKTYPCIFYHGEFVGGYCELKKVIRREVCERERMYRSMN